MVRDMQSYFQKIASYFNERNLAVFIKKIQPDIQELQDFRFYFSNPVFGLLIFGYFLILSQRWGIKKSFSYCLLISSILYLTTKIICYTDLPINGSGLAYSDIIKFLSIIIIALISVYYFIMKD